MREAARGGQPVIDWATIGALVLAAGIVAAIGRALRRWSVRVAINRELEDTKTKRRTLELIASEYRRKDPKC